MSGFTTIINGLNATAQSIEVISNNVANANTVGFKSGELTFGDQLMKALQAGEGGRISTAVNDDLVRHSFSAGALRTTSSDLDLAISGAGFFRVVPDASANEANVYYTRSGQFSSDKQGNIVNSNGLYLTGYLPTTAGDGVSGDLGILRIPESPMPPSQTTASTMSVYLDSRKALIPSTAAFNSLDSTTYNDLTTQTLFDAGGNQHSLAVYFRRTSGDSVDVYASLDGKFFDAAGQATTNETTGVPVKTLNFKNGVSVEADGASSKIALSGLITTVDKTTAPLAFSLDLGKTMLQATPFNVRTADQNGYALGALTGITVDETGLLVGQYSNGETKIGGQVALAMFNSPTGLSAASANAYKQTYSSGAPSLSSGAVDGFGAIRSKALEESNIDMAAELVMLMVQQRNFQANSQSFRTQDELLKNVINLA